LKIFGSVAIEGIAIVLVEAFCMVAYMNLRKEGTMAKDSLADLVKKEYDSLVDEKNELMAKAAEIDKKLEPILAFMNAGKKRAVGGQKRGRKPKGVSEPPKAAEEA